MKLTGLGFGNFRSIGSEPIFVDLSKKINVLIGANNSGKSNVIRALDFVAKDKNKKKSPGELDAHGRNPENAFILTVRGAIEQEDTVLASHFSSIETSYRFNGENSEIVCNPLESLDFPQFAPVFQGYIGRRIMSTTPAHQLKQHQEEVCLALVGKLLEQLPDVFIIPAIRRISQEGKYDFDGSGAVEALFKWQTPDIGEDALKKRFLQIQELLARLLKIPKIKLEVPSTKDKIIVSNGTLRLPLESYGTGVHELIVLAIDVYSKDNAIFCIEEPEIHLHARLQKEFLRFLLDETNNRYVLSTHSHALMGPSTEINIVHVWQESGASKGRIVETDSNSLDVLKDLGVNASDLLQANCVIWVEGPSDRIYLKRWLELMAPDLREGIDYVIMFYGGRLLSHVTMERNSFPKPDALIRLLRINQNSAIIIDSDRKKATDKTNATKRRVARECKNNDLLCWITDGREIENYLPVTAISKAYHEITGNEKAITLGPFGKLEEQLQKAYGKHRFKKAWSYDNAKVERAHQIAPHVTSADLANADLLTKLKSRLRKLLDVIGKAS